MKKIFNYFKNARWFKYWMAHIIVAWFISGVFLAIGIYALPFAGALFYLSREITQWEEKGYFDWTGLLFPILACIFLAWIL